jgi:PAS domain S-box-containing protein
MSQPLRILILEDNPTDAELVLRTLRRAGHELQWERVETEAAFLAALDKSPDLILSDYSMPQFDGLRAMDLLRERGLDIPFILISGTIGEEMAVEAIKRGADDYLLKDRIARLGLAVDRALEDVRLREERRRMEESLRNAETRLRLATEASNIGTWDWNLITDEVYFSPEWKRQLGYGDDELPNHFSEWESRLHPEDHDRILQRVAAFRADSTIGYEIEFRLRHRDGSYRWIQSQAMLVQDTEGRAIRMVGCHVDITETLRARRALQETEERYRALFDRSRDAVFVHDLDGRFVDANPAALKLLGYEREEIGAQDFATLLSNEKDQSRARCALRKLLTSDVSEGPLQFQLKRKDGALIWVELVSSLVFAEGRPVAVQGIARDITERKRTEEQLRKLSQAVEQSPASTIITDKAGRIEYVNPRFTKLTGYSLKEVEGLNPRFLKGDATSTGTYRELWRTITAGGEWRGEFHNRKKNGELFWEWASISPVHDADGAITHFLAVKEDITERRNAEQKLREQAALLDKAQDAIIVRDLAHRITYWNRSAERLYGWTAEEAVGRSIKELLYRDPTTFMAATAAALTKGEWVGELEQVDRHGRAMTVEGRWTRVTDERGEPASILAINTDITEKKKVEAQFLRAQRMESIGTLAGGIAHDLNNVLAPILVSIELIRDEVKSEDGHAMLKTLESCAQRGADLVRQVLGFARGVEGERMEVNVGHLLRDIRQIIRETFPRNIEISTQSPRDLWPVLGDPTQLHQVFMNLCVNARDAMPQGGHLQVAADNVELDEMYAGMHPDARPGSYLVVTVKDSGTGIPATVRDRMFEPFFTTKEIGKGTGLGLSTTLAIVRSHGGWINVCSEPGQGSSFKVYLPGKPAAPATEQGTGPAPALPRGRGETILLVDDEASIREVTRKILERFGYQVLVAIHGAEAVAMYAQHRDRIAVVITDMAMPVMDGRSTIAALHAMNPRLRIIASSGQENAGAASQAADAGVRHFLLKPYTAEAVLMTLAEVLGQPERTGS